ncbi:MAG: FHA domain-containing protein, partial [Candidatus Eremiobacteraeota bacterium]|nr:FHA domain-containing protein [Candidatus Eremiobacteraeota bacterium]
MSLFAKIEEFCAGFIERAFARTFPSDLEPAQIARKLVSTMQSQARDDNGRLRAPKDYAVYVSPDDFARLSEHREYLQRAWSDLLRELAEKVGIALEGAPAVTLAARETVPLGAIAIESNPRDAPAHLVLRTIKGVPPNRVYSLGATTRIGRNDDNDVVLHDQSVSRAHATVVATEKDVVLTDLKST